MGSALCTQNLKVAGCCAFFSMDNDDRDPPAELEHLNVRSRAYRGIRCDVVGTRTPSTGLSKDSLSAIAAATSTGSSPASLAIIFTTGLSKLGSGLHQFTLPFDHQDDIGNTPTSKPLAAPANGFPCCKYLVQNGGHEIRLGPRLDRRPDPCPPTRGPEEGRMQKRYSRTTACREPRPSALPGRSAAWFRS